MRILFLGTQNVDPTFGSSLGVVCEESGRRILLDCGPYAVPGLAKVGISVDDIEVIFPSHDHADHCGGLPSFVMTWLLASRTRPEKLTLAVPHAKLAMCDYIRAGYPVLFSENNPRKIDVHGTDLVLGDMFVEWIQLEHAVETWGAVVSKGDTKLLAYLPDSLPQALDEHVDKLRGVENLIMSVWGPAARQSDAAKFKFSVATDAGRIAQEVGAKRLYVQHLANSDDFAQVSDEASAAFAGSVVLPTVGEWIALD